MVFEGSTAPFNGSGRRFSARSNSITAPSHRRIDEIRRDSVLSRYGKYNIFLLVVAFAVNTASIYSTTVGAYIIPAATCKYNLNSFDIGLLNAAPVGGNIAGAYMWGFLSDTYGRKNLIIIGSFLDVAMTVMSSVFVPGSYSLLFFRFMSGFMVCGPYTIFFAYLSETFDNKHRNFAIMVAGFYNALGCILHSCLAMAIIPLSFKIDLFGFEFLSWRLFVVLSAIPSLITALAALFFTESPKFLLDMGHKKEALKVFQKIYTINTGHDSITYPVHNLRPSSRIEVNRPSSSNNKILRAFKAVFGQFSALFKKGLLMRTLVAFTIQFGTLISMNVLRVQVPKIFDAVAAHQTPSNETCTLCEVLQAPSPTTIDANCDEVGVDSLAYTSVMLIYGVVIIFLSVATLATNFVSKQSVLTFVSAAAAINVAIIPWVPVSYIMYLIAPYISWINVYFFTLTSVIVELFPTNLRATGVSMALMVGRVGILIGNVFLTPLLFTNCITVMYLFCGFLTAVAVITFLAPFQKPEPVTPPIKKVRRISQISKV